MQLPCGRLHIVLFAIAIEKDAIQCPPTYGKADSDLHLFWYDWRFSYAQVYTDKNMSIRENVNLQVL